VFLSASLSAPLRLIKNLKIPMPPIPNYLIFLIIILVIIPAVAAIILRLKLYQHLGFLQRRVIRLINRDSSGEKPKIIEELERRFQKARNNLEQVNTPALIDQLYSREKLWIFTYEELDYFCRILPNLLLVFGLFGTFLGITINLTSLSATINQTNVSDINSIVTELEKPLQGMSIAFTTSLIALIFSAILTVFNSIKNTSIAKYRLLSSLEDYLDNIYQPEIPGYTRLDIIVNRMVSQQDEFLSRFGTTVRDAVESSMGNVAKQIAQGNREVTQLATQVYERFTEASGTISTAANKFDNAMEALSRNAQIFQEAAETFESSQFPDKLSSATEDLANTQKKFSESADSLAETMQEIQHYSQELTTLATEIKSINQTSVEVLELHQSNQISLTEIIPQLKQGANSFAKASNKLDKLEKRIEQRADSLNGVIESLTQLLTYVKTHTDTVESSFDVLSQKIIDRNQTFLTNLEGYFNQIGVKIDTFKVDYEESFKNNNSKIIEGYGIVGKSTIAEIRKQTESSQKMYQNTINKLQECVKQLNLITQEIHNLRANDKLTGNQNDKKISN
jgi:methyl-accepting chemotaxis protein